MEKRIIQVEEKVPAKMLIPLSIQHMFAMFGASVLVPFLFGISPAIVLLMNGVGTLLFIFITKGKAPAYLGSSFAFLSPALLVISKYGYEYALGGFVVLGIAGMCVALIVRQCGTDWIDIVLPTAAMGPVDRSGTCGKCSKYGRTSGREGRSEECDRISGHTWSCGIRADPVPGLPFCYSDPDRDHCGICGSRCMRASGFYTGKGSGIFGSSQLYISEI